MEGPFSFLEDSKHAYYLVFDFERAVTSGDTRTRKHSRSMPLDQGRARDEPYLLQTPEICPILAPPK